MKGRSAPRVDWERAVILDDPTAVEQARAILAERTKTDPVSGCRRWTRHINGKGYGSLRFRGRQVLVHRLAWLAKVGTIRADLMLDHVRDRGCVYRDCVLVAHLEVVDNRTNTARGDSPGAIVVRTGVCGAGLHDMTGPANVYVQPNSGARACRPCHSARPSRDSCSDDLAERVLHHLADHPVGSGLSIARAVGVHRTVAIDAVRRLVREGRLAVDQVPTAERPDIYRVLPQPAGVAS